MMTMIMIILGQHVKDAWDSVANWFKLTSFQQGPTLVLICGCDAVVFKCVFYVRQLALCVSRYKTSGL